MIDGQARLSHRANRVRLVAAGIAALAIAVCAPAAARADGGGATVRALPESSSVEVSARVEHSCASETPCAWFAAAAVYSSSSGCPYSFDATHGVWQSGLEEVGVPTDGHFTISGFTLAKMEATIVVCLYVYSEGSTTLVGQSHPFDRATGREVLPPPAEAPAPERHRRRARYDSELCKPVRGLGGNAPSVWIMHVHGVHCGTARAVAKAVDRWPSAHRFAVVVARHRWTCTEEEVQGPEDPFGEATCRRGGAVVVVGLGG